MENINDDEVHKLEHPSDEPQHLSVRTLLMSKILDTDIDNIPKKKEPPDKGGNLRTRYRLTLNAMRRTRTNGELPTKTDEDVEFEGMDWIRTSNGWEDSSRKVDDEGVDLNEDETTRYLQFTKVTIAKCQQPMPQQRKSSDTYLQLQSDHGANANITDNLRALTQVQYIDPTTVASADKKSSLSVTAIGKLPLRAANGNIYHVLCYYSPNSDGTLLSPNAICAQFNHLYYGFHIYGDMDKGLGEVVYLGREGVDDLIMTTYKSNNLWWHTSDSHPLCRPIATDETVGEDLRANKLSNAAKWELWHQRLGHCGTRVLENIHKHVHGVPKLQGNAFYKCPSCMSGKLCTKQPTHRKGNLGTVIDNDNNEEKSSNSNPLESQEALDAWLDEIHLPDAEPGQHFHADFGFVRGSEFSLKLEGGKTVTSVDGKNSYLLIADRKTCMIWTHCNNTKAAPVKEVRAILQKFKSVNPHRTIRTDQDKALGKSKEFQDMVVDEGFVLESTGSDNSKQNSRAERPHKDLGQMMRCMLHGAGLGPEYWSHALSHAV